MLIATAVAIGMAVTPPARCQAPSAIVGFWEQTSGSINHEYAFTKDGKFESKLYGTQVYQITYGTYVLRGDQLTLTWPDRPAETYRWKVAMEYNRPTLRLTDSFGATSPFYFERFDQRYTAGPLIPYSKASLVGAWTVSHGRMRWGYAFTADGRYRSIRKGEAVNETVEGTYQAKGEIVILMPSGKPPHPLLWRIELENNAQTLILLDPYGAFEVFYRDKAY